ncbi:Carboxyesterase 17 [Tripterygium wilfordii]|uniref:Carboxyesterase 17 n=1 Tax=Tripterygium wilfordii TaxID=458696 RepID=A0A7J7DU64_TRIWF|nr:probable carboxylesterase 17 [Tripterygium wilfordii]KAF5749918.1 Carboxyesterase 17 [Tripterygium wilfordii]
MAAISFDPRLNHQVGKKNHGVVLEEIEGLIRVYKDGNVERPPLIPNVPCTAALGAGVTARDVVIDRFTNLWARIYVPSCPGRLPVLVYFHGGGFCVGSAAWSCYHDFIANLAVKAGCVILSINYRLAPENQLPTAYEDGTNAVVWLKQQALNGSSENKWWLSKCSFSSLFLGGDSAGANIAYHVTTRLGSNGTFEPTITNPLCLKGTILIQPFFGGEARTGSEKNSRQPPNSALTLSASDTYWRLSLPAGDNRDHPWCNPLANGASKLRDLALPSAMLVCISEMDILKDRNSEFCNALASAGKRVEAVMHKGVGHAFQILHNSPNAQTRIQEMVSHLKSFINENQ